MYQTQLVSHQATLEASGLFKRGLDLARLLDGDLLTFDSGLRGSLLRRLVESHRQVFDALCDVCVTAGVPMPDLELEMLRAMLPDKDELKRSASQRRKMITAVHEGLATKQVEAAEELSALATVLELFHFDDFGGTTLPQFLAAINIRLIEAGLAPIRKEYAGRVVAPGEGTTGKTRKLLIVDDMVDDIVRTWIALAGWPTLQLEFYRHIPKGYDLKEEARAQRVKEVIRIIRRRRPDIILMDQGLGDIGGEDLVLALRDHKHPPIIVGNTGGDGKEFKEVGLYSNFNKGKSPHALASVLS